ncbi:hypothetical protein [Streptomyces sp. NRRL S-1868]|uniref:hypothetical protein n=1 Tax=Streptomyces sp. NRRL S-1868 TaxID=1463892 RepID=UPI000ABB4CCD|nr:hypothetical protein [Streptomyces sp. NRRL S-1868]
MGRRRRAVAAAAALVLAAEAAVLVLLNLFLGKVVDEQDMSLAGIDPRAMTVSAWIGAAVVGVYLFGCALLLARTALRDRPPRGLWRIVLISCAVVHGLLGAFSVGLVGWSAFVVMMVVLGLIVWTLTWYPTGEEPPAGAAAGPEAEEQPAGAAAD